MTDESAGLPMPLLIASQTEPIPGSKIYLTGVKDAASGEDYFYFEIPLDKQSDK